MNPNHRSTRKYWIAGLVLLLGSAVGARWAMSGDNGDSASSKTVVLENAPAGYICLGKVDVPSGVAMLYPAQPGCVTMTAAEGAKVEKGDVLLRVDTKLAELRVAEAKADLDAAVEKHELAKFAKVEHQNKLDQIQDAIAAAEKKKQIASQEWKLKSGLHKDGVLSDEELAISKNTLELAGIGIEIEKKKQIALKKYEPQWLIRQAKANVDAKKAQLKKAELGRDECEVKAPANGLVLRVYAKVGELLGPNPKYAAMEFCPNETRIVRAEVLQEWAHLVVLNQTVDIVDDSRSKLRWKGRIKSISDWFSQKRDIRLQPFMVNDVLTLECIVEVDPKSGPTMRIGQRVMVKYN